jgi:aquaporin Z
MTTHTLTVGGRAAASERRWHFREYALEAVELGLFMLSACCFVSLIEHPASPLRQALPDAWLRRLLIGVAMGSTAVALIYSPWGKRSGAHMNPAVTLTFLRLGKISPRDASMYVVAQFLGATLGVRFAALLLGDVLRAPAVNFVVTQPLGGVALAFCAEVGISALPMRVVLWTTRSARLSPFTGLFCGALVAAFITFEAPLSGMSMNPARSFGSALVAGQLQDLWLYLLAPLLGMGLAARLAGRDSRAPGCAKLQHDARVYCIFCSAGARSHETPSIRAAGGTPEVKS